MKKILTLILILISLNLLAQDNLGYFSFDGSLTQVNSYPAGSAGVTMALTRIQDRAAIINSLSFGITGNFIFDSPDSTNYKSENKKRYCGYGGILIEPAIISKFPIHITLPCIIGVGTLKYATVDDNYWTSYDEVIPESKSTYLVFSAGARIELNLLSGLRFTCGPSYRYVPNLYVNGEKSDMLNSFNLDFSFKIGKYK